MVFVGYPRSSPPSIGGAYRRGISAALGDLSETGISDERRSILDRSRPVSGAARDTVLGKATLILQAFTIESTTLTFAQVRDRSGLPKATTHRLLTDLVGVGLLERNGPRYRLSRLVFELGLRASAERSLFPIGTGERNGTSRRLAF
ncbi:helix-turn-helix domain-containing protein [Nocardia sp. CA-290969]|uniref:helix-turn-helix domain-containing protein n=1 Tax=Nocardia sp. CA-290969 TaxID=3239986 RepID=UPI003D8FD49B